jgi:hypothetical protein
MKHTQHPTTATTFAAYGSPHSRQLDCPQAPRATQHQLPPFPHQLRRLCTTLPTPEPAQNRACKHAVVTLRHDCQKPGTPSESCFACRSAGIGTSEQSPNNSIHTPDLSHTLSPGATATTHNQASTKHVRQLQSIQQLGVYKGSGLTAMPSANNQCSNPTDIVKCDQTTQPHHRRIAPETRQHPSTIPNKLQSGY